MASCDQANRGEKLGLVWRKRKKNLPNYQWLPLLTVLHLNYYMQIVFLLYVNLFFEIPLLQWYKGRGCWDKASAPPDHPGRVSSKQKTKIWFKLKQTETRSVWVVFRFVSWNQKLKFRFDSVCFGVLNLYQNNQNKQNCLKKTETTLNFSEKYQNMVFIKLSQFVICLFRLIKTSKLSVSV